MLTIIFIDTQDSGNWFDKVLTAKAGRGVFTYPGALDRVHAWAYLPDLARTAVALAQHGDALGRFVDMPFAGYSLTGQELGQAVGRALGRAMRVQQMPWAPIRALGLVNPMMRCLTEMRYLWDMPHRLDPGPLNRVLPDLRLTPLHQALISAVPAVPEQVAARKAHFVGHARIV